MALEPLMPTAEDEESEEYLDMRRRFLHSLILTVPVFIFTMGHMTRPSASLSPPEPPTGFSSSSPRHQRGGGADGGVLLAGRYAGRRN